MNELFEDKYGYGKKEYDYVFYDAVRRRNGYGYVRVKNPNYTPYKDEREYLIRKPTTQERREIVINTVIECNGRSFKISKLAYRLGVSERTLQLLLRQLEKERLIEIIPRHNENGKQKANAYKYIGPPCEKYGTGLTLQALYDNKQNVGFRDWTWREYEFEHNKVWHDSIYLLCKKKFEMRMARREYLEANGLPLVVPEDTKYLVLRYCYWKGNKAKLAGSYLFTQDRTIKLSLEPLNRTETVMFYGITLYAEIGGTKDNPQVAIIDADTNKLLTVFTWFDENVLVGDCDLDRHTVDQVLILGDFTTK